MQIAQKTLAVPKQVGQKPYIYVDQLLTVTLINYLPSNTLSKSGSKALHFIDQLITVNFSLTALVSLTARVSLTTLLKNADRIPSTW